MKPQDVICIHEPFISPFIIIITFLSFWRWSMRDLDRCQRWKYPLFFAHTPLFFFTVVIFSVRPSSTISISILLFSSFFFFCAWSSSFLIAKIARETKIHTHKRVSLLYGWKKIKEGMRIITWDQNAAKWKTWSVVGRKRKGELPDITIVFYLFLFFYFSSPRLSCQREVKEKKEKNRESIKNDKYAWPYLYTAYLFIYFDFV